MKDAELISRLQEVLIPGNWGGSQEDQLRHVHQGIAAIIVALEANPPKAEVEVEARQRLSIQLDDKRADVHIFNVPVTVTIRKKHEG